MTGSSLHFLARMGELEGLRVALADPGQLSTLNEPDQRGSTPLMYAAAGRHAAAVALLLSHGARIDVECERHGSTRQALAVALASGDIHIVAALIAAGADIHYRRPQGYNALIDAVYGRDIFRDEGLLDLLRLLISHGVDLNAISSHGESGLTVLSRIGRFDAVALLLEAGADPAQIEWTPLLQAVALGSLADVEAQLDAGQPLEQTDRRQRTAWLLAIQTGDVEKMRLLAERGANLTARGRCDRPPLSYAVLSHSAAMVQALLDMGMSMQDQDKFGGTPLFDAVEEDVLDCVRLLLRAGADPNAEHSGSVLSHARSPDMARCLLEAGSDLQELPASVRRAFLGLSPEADEGLLDCLPKDFLWERERRFGRANPEEMDVPFWKAAIRAGVGAYAITQHFGMEASLEGKPVWCAERYGQSMTFLPDGRIIQVGGEHEDYYDPDFCIYNDVFVHEPDGSIRIYGYPEKLFPPTDFHTATLVGGTIYLIGSLGYRDDRRPGETQVFRLDTKTFRMEPASTSGQAPGWISRHRARLEGQEIHITHGSVITVDNGVEAYGDNTQHFVLNLKTLEWRQIR